MAFLCQPEHLREEVTIICRSELFSSSGEGRTWHAAGEQIDSCVSGPIEFSYIDFHDIPLGSVVGQRVACMWIELDKRS